MTSLDPDAMNQSKAPPPTDTKTTSEPSLEVESTDLLKRDSAVCHLGTTHDVHSLKFSRYIDPCDAPGGSRSPDMNPSPGVASWSNGETSSLLTRSPSAPAELFPVDQSRPFRSLNMAGEPSVDCRPSFSRPPSPPVVHRTTDKDSPPTPDNVMADAPMMHHPFNSDMTVLLPLSHGTAACIGAACPGWRPPTNIPRASRRQVGSLVKKVWDVSWDMLAYYRTQSLNSSLLLG